MSRTGYDLKIRIYSVIGRDVSLETRRFCVHYLSILLGN